MKTSRTKILRRVVVSASLLSAIGLATALGQDQNGSSEDNGRCKQIKARAITVTVTENCPSPIHLCATGVVTGDELIRGRTFASVLGLAPSVGLPGVEPPTSLSLAGERSITTTDGTLRFRFITVFDTARGEFAEIERVTDGTERFEGATGTLWFTGTGTGPFDVKITGQVCGPNLHEHE